MKTKALISFAVTVKLICVFVFEYADCWFSHEAALMISFFEDLWPRQQVSSKVRTEHALPGSMRNLCNIYTKTKGRISSV